MGDEQHEDFDPLSGRELEILRLITDGLTNQQIAGRLFLTLDTVKWYNTQTFQKLRVQNRTQAVARAHELGFFSDTGHKSGWPSPSTTFVGRKNELVEIGARLADPACRILTLVGPGGIGKTRLALEAAREQEKAFSHGVYFVPLASIASPAFIVQVFTDALNLPRTGDPLARITHFLREKAILLVIDNFEHLLDGTPTLIELVAKSRQTKLLVTSRERLHLKEEWLFDVQGLRCPAGQASEDPAQYEAVELFVQTAQRVQADFSLSEGDHAHVAHICRLVGGMPLGIELAASWIRVLSCAEIAREIEQGLDILRTTWKDVPERHRSIQAVLDHSWKMLSETDQRVFSRLTVFRGRFSREAAAEVAGASLIHLLELVDKSFLKQVEAGQFTVHELMKQYGLTKLAHDEETQTRWRHCRYFAGRMVAGQPEQIEAEFDDIQAAWRFAIDNKALPEIEQLATGFATYYRLQSWYKAGSDSVALYERALDCFAPGANPPATICLCESLGHLSKLFGAPDRAMNYFERALAETDPTHSIRRGYLYREIGGVYVMLNEHEQAHNCYDRAESTLNQAEERNTAWWHEWTCLQTERMWLYYWGNRVDDMIALDSRVRTLVDQYGLPTMRARYQLGLAGMAMRRDRYFHSKDAIAAGRRALAISLETGNLESIASCHFSLGVSLLWSDHLDEAEKLLQLARELTEQSGDLTLLARAVTYLSVVYRKHDDLAHVQEYAAHTLRVAGEAKMPQYTGIAHAQYAWLALREGNMNETEQQAQAAIDDWGGLAEARTVIPFRWLALFPLMGVALEKENIEQAVQWSRHLLLPLQMRLPDVLAATLERAVIAWDAGNANETNNVLREAFKLAQMMRYV